MWLRGWLRSCRCRHPNHGLRDDGGGAASSSRCPPERRGPPSRNSSPAPQPRLPSSPWCLRNQMSREPCFQPRGEPPSPPPSSRAAGNWACVSALAGRVSPTTSCLFRGGAGSGRYSAAAARPAIATRPHGRDAPCVRAHAGLLLGRASPPSVPKGGLHAVGAPRPCIKFHALAIVTRKSILLIFAQSGLSVLCTRIEPLLGPAGLPCVPYLWRTCIIAPAAAVSIQKVKLTES